MNQTRFGVSTHLYHDRRLGRDDLMEIASFGFEAIEIFATRTHLDYHDPRAVDALGDWVRDAHLALHSIHAPIVESLIGGTWGPRFSNATTDEAERARAVREADAALNIARRLGASVLVVHLGVPAEQKPSAADNNPNAARRSLEEIHGLASPLGVRLALEVIPNALSTPQALVRLIEEDLDLPEIGICMDVGHALLMGDVVEAIEIASGHLQTTHIHDNGGVRDDHLVPFEGTIDWAGALTGLQKVGYEGVLMLEIAGSRESRSVLESARRARGRFEQILLGA